MKKIFLALALVAAMSANAQTDNKVHVAVGVNLGTTGVGLEAATSICPNLDIRAGFDFVPQVEITSTAHYERPSALNNVPAELLATRYVNIPPYGADIDIKGKPFMSQGKVLFDIYPTKKTSFHFTVGAMIGSSEIAKLRAADKTVAAVELYNQDIKNGLIVAEPGFPNGITIEFEGYAITPNKGRAEVDARVNSFRPYVGIGFGRSVPRKNIGCKFELGMEFWGKIKVVDKYGDHEITEDEPNISSDLKDVLSILNKVPGYPCLKFSVFGKIL